MIYRTPIMIALLFLSACFQSEGGELTPIPGIDLGADSCGTAMPCPSGSICHPTGICIQCPGGTCILDGGPPPEDASTADSTLDSAFNQRDVMVSPDSQATVDSAMVPPDQGAQDSQPIAPDMCRPQPESCNGLDDDCDQRIDETFDTLSDGNHCGGCDIVCQPFANGDALCADGQCTLGACLPGWSDQDGIAQNGCETALREITFVAPIADDAVAGGFQIIVAMTAFEDLGQVEIRGNGQLITRQIPAERIEAQVDENEFDEGNLILNATSYDLMGEVVSRATMEILIDRTGPTITFVAPAVELLTGPDPFDILVNIVDNAPPVTVEFQGDMNVLGQIDTPPYQLSVEPVQLGAGERTLRVIALDRAGNRSEITRTIRLSFCGEDEMALIPDLDVLIDRFENSRPDATANSSGIDESRACSQSDVIPWHQLDHFAAADMCMHSGKRLCTLEEWRQACSGRARRQFPYQGGYNDAHCNGLDRDPQASLILPTGSLPDCQTPEGVADLSGNLAEWISSERQSVGVSGGDYRSGVANLACDGLREYQPATLRATHGFRCCKDIE